MALKFEEYPKSIAEIQNKINANLEKCEGLKLQINEINAIIDGQVAFDDSLKNEQQRKSRKLEIISEDSDYASLSSILMRYEWGRKELIVELEKRQNEFTILKLAKREAIATMEATSHG
jgi:hypothetical protein